VQVFPHLNDGRRLTLGLTQTFRTVSINGEGRLDKELPFTSIRHPNTPGVDTKVQDFAYKAELKYDTRDSDALPTEGVYINVFFEIADEKIQAENDRRNLGFEAVGLFPFLDAEFVAVIRLAGQIIAGKNLPFYLRSQLGGKSTLRGFGVGRFNENHFLVANAELRWTFLDYHMADIRQQLQLAAFIDTGRVFAEEEEFTPEDLHIAAGGALRLIVPNSDIVISIDVGGSKEGAAGFLGLGYPF